MPAVSLSNPSHGLDGRSGARVRKIDFNLTPDPVSACTAKVLTGTMWSIKEEK
jgi:topoisomerase-4 subunit A